MTAEAAEFVEIKAAAIQAAHPDAADYLEQIASAAGALTPGCRSSGRMGLRRHRGEP